VKECLWEYRVVGQTDNPLENQAKLNRLGEEGWELVAVSMLGNGGTLAAYLKRPRDASQTEEEGRATPNFLAPGIFSQKGSSAGQSPDSD